MRISKKAESIAQSVIVEIMTKAKRLKKQGVDIVSFAVGEPDFDTPPFIKDACTKAMEQGYTRYTPGMGTIELREAISKKLKYENDLAYDPEKEIVITVGAKNALFQALFAIMDTDEDVLLPSPYWVTYPEMIKLTGANLKIIKTHENNSYKLTPQILEDAITSKSRAIILNYPNNPAGFCYSPEELVELAKIIQKTNLIVISDEIYEKLVYGKTRFRSFAAVAPELYDRTITINGFSKTYAMTGWRVGYAAGPKEIIDAIARIQSQISLGTATFCQIAAIDALNYGQPDIQKMTAEFEKRAKYVYERLRCIDGITCNQSEGTFYAFPNVSKLYQKYNVSGSFEFCNLLLEKAKVACVPGISFGCDDNIRLSFATSMEDIEKGMNRIQLLLTSR